jgi:uncharacterized OsmC-like protein
MATNVQEVSIVNGINVPALQQAIAQIEADLKAGKTCWKVNSRWRGGTRSDHQVDGFEIGGQTVQRQFQIQIDEPLELCGTNQFANPQEYLLAATNACMMVGYAAVAALMGVTLTELELEISGDIDLRGFLDLDGDVPPGYGKLHYTVRIAGEGTREQFEKIHQTVQRTSPNYYNISHPVELTSDLVVTAALSEPRGRQLE